MKKITLIFTLLFGFFVANSQNPFTDAGYESSSTVCYGDGAGACDPMNSNIPLDSSATVSLNANANEFVLSDITGGLYAGPYGETDNSVVVVVDDVNQTLSVVDAPDTVYGGDVFNATGSYTTDTNGDVDTFTLTWSNGFGDAGTTDFSLFNCPSISFPYNEDFDSASVLDFCYTIVDQDANGTSWIQESAELQPLVESTFATNGTNAAQKEDYLISPAIAMTAGNTYDISITYNGANSTNGNANEALELLVAQGNAVADVNAGTSVFSDTGIIQNGASNAELETQAFSGAGTFSPTASGDYYVALKSTGSPLLPGGSTGFLLVFDFSVSETLSVDQFETLSFDYFVDAQNNLSLSASQSFEQVNLFNLLGQQVLSQKLNSQNESVDLNALTSGVYLAQVQINGTAKTFKIVKK